MSIFYHTLKKYYPISILFFLIKQIYFYSNLYKKVITEYFIIKKKDDKTLKVVLKLKTIKSVGSV